MREIKNDPFYEIIKEYDKCVIDYCLLEDDAPYAGHEWWGTACWSVFDRNVNRFVVLMASATD